MPLVIPSPKTRRRAAIVALGCAFALVLGACHREPPPSNATPDEAVATSLRLTAAGDFDALMTNRLPAPEYTEWRAQWDSQRAHSTPAPIAQQKQFARIMLMLTEPDAEAKLAKRIQPLLANPHGGKGDPLPIFGGILEASARQMIEASPQLGPAQRALATQGLQALTAWAAATDFSDPKKAGKAIALATATARELHVQTLEQWRALDYATTMRNYGILWNGLQRVLKLYGLDLAASLTSARTSTATSEGNHATVKLTLTLAGKPLAGEWPMLKQDGHWYDAALLEAWRQAHPAAAPGSSVAAAPAATSAAAASTIAAPPATAVTASGAATDPTPSGSQSH